MALYASTAKAASAFFDQRIVLACMAMLLFSGLSAQTGTGVPLAIPSEQVLDPWVKASLEGSFQHDHRYGDCPTVPSPEQWAWLRAFQADDAAQAQARGGGMQYVKVKAHIVGKNDRSGYYKHKDLLESICEINEQFASTGMYFYLDLPVEYHNNDSWWDQTFWEGFDMINSNNVDGALNVYYVGRIEGGGIAGYYSPSADGVVMTNGSSAPGQNTLAHEFGHYFSLPHTFFGWEGGGTPPLSLQERMDGSNCNSAADGFCDTPPDYAYYRWSCPSVGPFIDPNGVEFDVVDSFFMSYGGNSCRDRFSPQQSAAMRANLNGPHASNEGFITPHFPNGYDSVRLVMPADGSFNLAPIGERFAWTPVDSAVAYHVSVGLNTIFSVAAEEKIVTDTFWYAVNLPEDRKLYWRVKPIFEGNTCEPYSPVSTFTTGELSPPTTGIEDPRFDALRVYPNPLPAGTSLLLDFPLEGEWTAQWRDALGRRIHEQRQALGAAAVSRWTAPDAQGWFVVEWRSPSGEGFRRPVLLR
jgi:hypothetical protein